MRVSGPEALPLEQRAALRRRGLTRHPAGMALVTTLALLVLITIATMAFFTRATANRQIESTRANQVVASQLAATAADYVLGQFLSEIPTNATASGSPGQEWYQVTNSVGALPLRKVSASATGTNFANLVRQSVPDADANASGHGTAAASQNGRLVAASRWNEPYLNFGDGFTATNQTPNWVYLNRDGTATNAPGTNSIGRFAYNVYDVSGLLDANIAGNPALSEGNLFDVKHTQAGADLTALPDVDQSAINQLVAFRSPMAATGEAFKTAALAWQETGFLSPRVGVNGSLVAKNTFSSRSDLLRYVRQENPGLIPALPFLSHFSVAANRPAVPVDGNDDNIPDASPVRRLSDATVARYRDDGSPFEDEVRAGDLLLDRKFSLAKLSWITHSGPAHGISPDAIQACLGLRWNPTERRWDYVGHSGLAVRDELFTLEQVAAQNRDPNFFEILYAGIGRDSMDLGMGRYWGLVGFAAEQWGVDAGQSAYTGSAGFDFDSSPQFQAMQIGVNLLDQADRDNFPTTIRFFTADFYGIEDLPLVSGVFTKPYYLHQGNSGTQFGDPPVSVWLIPQFWNPHRAGAAVPGPTRIRLDVSGNSNWRISMSIPNPSPTNPNRKATVQTPLIATAVSGTAEFVLSGADNFRSRPGPLLPGTGVNGPAIAPPGLSGSQFDPAIGFFAGTLVGPWPNSFLLSGPPPYEAGTNPGGNPNSPRLHLELNNLKLVLSYEDANGHWRPYFVFGNEGILSPPLTGSTSTTVNHSGLAIADLYRTCPAGPGPRILRALDPRTGRFGLTFTTQSTAPGSGAPADYANSTMNPASNQELVAAMGYTHQAPLAFPAPGTFGSGGWGGNVPTARFWSNTETIARYPDRDGIIRPADGALAANSANPMFQSATGAANAVSASDRTRPIILQRPLRTVAELGYVSRGQPWKTLDFFSEQSADGPLLDLLSVSDGGGGLVAGMLNLRAAHPLVIQAILRETPYDDIFARNPGSSGAAISNADAETISAAFSPSASSLRNASDFPSLVAANALALPDVLAKPSREAASRPLVAMSDLRTLRLFADLIAQVGRFPSGGAAPEGFVVEGEKRIWVSLAVDRSTGKVIYREGEQPLP